MDFCDGNLRKELLNCPIFKVEVLLRNSVQWSKIEIKGMFLQIVTGMFQSWTLLLRNEILTTNLRSLETAKIGTALKQSFHSKYEKSSSAHNLARFDLHDNDLHENGQMTFLSDFWTKIPDRNMNLNVRNTFLWKLQLML